MKNYFIANGEVLNTSMSVEDIEKIVNCSLEETTGGMARFYIKELSDKQVTMVYLRDFLLDPNELIVYDSDANLITDMGVAAFEPKQIGGYPLVFPLTMRGKNFYTDLTAFIRFYKSLLFIQTEQKVEEIGLRIYSDRILMQIIF